MRAIIGTHYNTLELAKKALKYKPFKRSFRIMQYDKGFLLVSKRQL
jgi:hypothetical protein